MINFEERSSNLGPTLAGSYRVGSLIDRWVPEIGTKVYLKSESVTIVAELTECSPPSYSAKVTLFEDYDGETLGGVRVGDEIHFQERHVHTFRK